jgi:hypothetical protein
MRVLFLLCNPAERELFVPTGMDSTIKLLTFGWFGVMDFCYEHAKIGHFGLYDINLLQSRYR